jgi:hypothetical protein
MVLERGPFSLVGTIEELLGRESSGSGLKNREYGRRESATLTTSHPLSAEVGINFPDKRRSLGRIVRSRTQATEILRPASAKACRPVMFADLLEEFATFIFRFEEFQANSQQEVCHSENL